MPAGAMLSRIPTGPAASPAPAPDTHVEIGATKKSKKSLALALHVRQPGLQFRLVSGVSEVSPSFPVFCHVRFAAQELVFLVWLAINSAIAVCIRTYLGLFAMCLVFWNDFLVFVA